MLFARNNGNNGHRRSSSPTSFLCLRSTAEEANFTAWCGITIWLLVGYVIYTMELLNNHNNRYSDDLSLSLSLLYTERRKWAPHYYHLAQQHSPFLVNLHNTCVRVRVRVAMAWPGLASVWQSVPYRWRDRPTHSLTRRCRCRCCQQTSDKDRQPRPVDYRWNSSDYKRHGRNMVGVGGVTTICTYCMVQYYTVLGPPTSSYDCKSCRSVGRSVQYSMSKSYVPIVEEGQSHKICLRTRINQPFASLTPSIDVSPCFSIWRIKQFVWYLTFFFLFLNLTYVVIEESEVNLWLISTNEELFKNKMK